MVTNGAREGHGARRRGGRLAGLSGPALLGANFLALAGFVLRDRNVALALLLYVPLPPLGLAAILVDLARRGRALRGPRFVLAAAGLASAACSVFTMVGRGPEAPLAGAAPGGEVRLMHWNVLWGGRPRTDAAWASIEGAILGRAPDVVVLSEPPARPRLDALERRLGAGWSSARVEQAPGEPYWFKLVTLSRWPVHKGRTVLVRNGAAVEVLVDRPGRPLRLLVVDGQSKVTQLRTPFLHDLAAACRRAGAEGQPYHLVVGDFNAVGRSVGFDALKAAAGGYRLASRACKGWRGTWPMPAPFLDIDHVWVRAGARVLSCALFADTACDHRGQLVRLAVP